VRPSSNRRAGESTRAESRSGGRRGAFGWLGRSARRLAREESGQDLVELVMVTPLLCLVIFGILEFGNILDSQQTVSYLTREGASMASRGVSMNAVLAATMDNGNTIQLEERGGVVLSRLVVEGGVPCVEEQVASVGYDGASRLGPVGEELEELTDIQMAEGANVYVLEIFYNRPTLTPVMAFLSGTVPEVLYDRAIF
jgi:Flp pilus assembly protein TadG